MFFQIGNRFFKLLGSRARADKAFSTIKDYVGKTGNVKVISDPTPAQIKSAAELSSSPSRIVSTLKKVGDMRVRSLQVPSAKLTKGIGKQSGETGEGLTDAQKAARSRASQKKFLKAEKPARKRQEGIQSAREQRRWAKRDAEDAEDAAKVVGTLKKRRTKGIAKQSSETGEGLTEVQKASRSRASQQKFLKVEKPARKRQEGIQSAREQRRWAERDAERKKGGKVGKKKRSSSNHADGNKLVASLYD